MILSQKSHLQGQSHRRRPEGENFHITQVYPLSMDEEMSKGIICLANKDISLPKNFDHSRVKDENENEGPGVDYFLSK